MFLSPGLSEDVIEALIEATDEAMIVLRSTEAPLSNKRGKYG